MSRSLIQFIDAALLPAALMLIGKVIGLILTVQLFNIPITIVEAGNSLFSVRPQVLPQDLQIVNTYSDMVMYLLVAAGFSFVLLQATRFHDTHIKPALLIKLSNLNLLNLVKSSFDIYHYAAIWLLGIWLTTSLIVLNAAFGKTESWVALVTIVGSVIFTSILLQDVYKEIELARKNLGKFQALS